MKILSMLVLNVCLFNLPAAVAAPPTFCDRAPSVVESPGKNLTLRFCLANGQPVYSVQHKQAPVITWSNLGLRLKDSAAFTGPLEIKASSRAEKDETWEQVWGEERFIRSHYRELTVQLSERGEGKKHLLNLVFRVFNDGLGFRYEIPRQKNIRQIAITDELTEFNFAQDHEAWWIDGLNDADYEQRYKKAPISKIPSALTPLTIEAKQANLFVSIHEAALQNYSGMFLVNQGPGRLRAMLYPHPDGVLVRANDTLKSPWRTIQVAEKAGDLVTSYLVLNLNEPNRLKETSWISPGKYMGIWWGMHLGIYSWGSGPSHGATTERAFEYINHAANLKIPALLIEGWNIGWDGDWQADGNVFDFTRAYPDFDLVKVTDYARSKGVEIVGHHETSAAVANYERQSDAAFALYQKLGIHKVKTGYVGQRMDKIHWRHGQHMVQHHDRITRKAARHEIMLDIHEPIKDTGLRRTFPNIMTREGACGAEYDAWGGLNNHNTPAHATILPFTRGLSGPFDYTPGIFDLERGQTKDDRVRTTLAKQLALYVVIYSPLHMAPDLPENYVGHPAFKFIQDVPTDWETTKVLSGEIGSHVTIARKDRHSGDWYLGAITNENARAIDLPLTFLDAEREYRAEIYADAADAHFLRNPKGYSILARNVKRGDVLPVQMAPGGGLAVRFVELGGK